jgi:hypothetical protein
VPQTPLPTANWTPFDRRDLAPVIAAAVALAAAAGTDPVELVVESPPLHWWQLSWRQRLSRRLARKDRGPVRDQARVGVTDADGRLRYPVHIRLHSTHGPDAGRKVDRRPGWTTSNSNGQAVLMMKAAAARTAGFDAAELVTGTVGALDDLHLGSPTRGWRFRVDRG